MKVAIQGQAGSFHDVVARAWYGDDYDMVPCLTFPEVFSRYEDGEAEAIVVAVENTLYGSINQVYGLIEACPSPIIGEIKLPVHQQLIACLSAKPDDITEIYSHPVALAQCRNYLAANFPDAEQIEYYDTAAAVEYIAELASPNAAAIAGVQAAELHKLPILAHDIHDDERNITRFLVLQDTPTDPGANRASLVITTSHQPGALVEVLQVFASAGVNLAKLQSQPIVGAPWSYKFFLVVDCAGAQLRQIVQQIEQSNHEVTLLGEYVRA